ncbi:MAG: hydrolase, alpha/beta fold family [Myxococcaceae bacterium]|nr:hydrolase, alpha/beta fold family [Myxococcaceae bacterium]
MSRWAFAIVALPMLFSMFGCMSFHQGPMPGEPKAATFANVDGVRVRYVDSGTGPTVVLIHGFASSLETWATVMPSLAGHRVIALDLKGFGWTDRPEGDYSPEAQARLVLGLLDQRGVDKATFVAHSWGASVALSAALAAPNRVERLALYDAWVYEEQLPPFFHWARADGVGEALFGLYYKERSDERVALAFYDKAFVTEALVDAVESALDRPGTVAAALAAVRGQRYARVQGRYREINKPTLLLWGREDAVTTVTYGERLVRDLKDARLVVYPRCGHFPMIEAAAQSTRDLVAFVSPASASQADPSKPAEPTKAEAP